MRPHTTATRRRRPAASTLALLAAALSAARAIAVEPVYVSIVMHNEEPNGFFPDYRDETTFRESRQRLVAFADVVHAHGAMFNWQSDWNFLVAVQMYDAGTPSTNGKNVVRYLKEDLGFEIDPHAHETEFSYADVAYLIEQVGVTPSNTVGGMVVFPPDESIVERMWEPIPGWMFPDESWQAEILWGGGTVLHEHEEHLWASGVWKPMDNDHFLVHDDDAPLANVGKSRSGWVGLDELLARQAAGELEDGLIHTCSVTVGQIQLDNAGFLPDFEAALVAADAAGDVIWAGLAEVVDIWQAEYDSVGHVHRWRTFGDHDDDGDVDLDDFHELVDCMTGPDPEGGVPDFECYIFDYGPDDDVDCDDWDQVEAGWTGAGDPPLLMPCDCHLVDLDDDGVVGTVEFLDVLAAWGPCDDCPQDFDRDGFVGTVELLVVLAAWGVCP